MNFQEVIKYLRKSCLIDDPEINKDPMYLALTNEDIESMLQVGYDKVTNVLPHLKDEDKEYAIILFSKQDVYTRLCLKYALQNDIRSEVGSLVKSQRFKHFSKLLEYTKEEWSEYLKIQQAQRDVSNTNNYSDLAEGQVFIGKNYFSNRSRTYAKNPQVKANIDHFTSSIVEISWKILSVNQFKEIAIYLSTNSIYDKYTNEIEGTKVATLRDIHREGYRIKDLKASTTYHIAIVVEELNGMKGIHEVIVTTEGETIEK